MKKKEVDNLKDEIRRKELLIQEINDDIYILKMRRITATLDRNVLALKLKRELES